MIREKKGNVNIKNKDDNFDINYYNNDSNFQIKREQFKKFYIKLCFLNFFKRFLL